jgi:hypothetical protein
MLKLRATAVVVEKGGKTGNGALIAPGRMPKTPVGKMISTGFKRGEAHFKKFPSLSPYIGSYAI